MKHSTPTFYSGEVRLIGLAFTQKLPMSWQAPNCRIRSDACHELLRLFGRPLCRLREYTASDADDRRRAANW